MRDNRGNKNKNTGDTSGSYTGRNTGDFKLELTEEESDAFWPLYVYFCRQLKQGREELRLKRPLKESLIAAGATEEEVSEVERIEVERLIKMYGRFSKAFSGLLGESRTDKLMRIYTDWDGPASE